MTAVRETGSGSGRHRLAKDNVLLEQSGRSRVQVRVGDLIFPARARVVHESTEPELAIAVQELSERKYGWGEGLVVELTPEP